jgi:hypothetical protein
MSALVVKVMPRRRARWSGGRVLTMAGADMERRFWPKREKERIVLYVNPVAAIPVMSRLTFQSL